MSGGDERVCLPMPPSRTWTSSSTMPGVLPRLPRSIGPRSPRVNLSQHWDELGGWWQEHEERRVALLAALQDGGSSSGLAPGLALGNWCRLQEARYAVADEADRRCRSAWESNGVAACKVAVKRERVAVRSP